jgi:hypothetical protein
MAATKAKPVEEDPLGVYLQVTREGDSNATSATQQFWIAALSQGGHTTTLYGKSKEEITERATTILSARGITGLRRSENGEKMGSSPDHHRAQTIIAPRSTPRPIRAPSRSRRPQAARSGLSARLGSPRDPRRRIGRTLLWTCCEMCDE